MIKFALIGASGYIAPRHVEAIKHVNGNLVSLLDPYDGIGYIDKYYPNASYFKETERFDRHLDRLKRKNQKVSYVSICSPNYLHDSHIRLALRNNCNVICEKPLVLKYDHLQSLQEIEKESENKVNTILQLRLHPLIQELKQKYSNTNKFHEVTLNYITPRGLWYDYSWKGDPDKSGGIATNIGVHFFDMLLWLFGEVIDFEFTNTPHSSKGVLILEKARVKYNLSINQKDLPWDKWEPYRSIKIDGKEIEFSKGFTELHKVSYKEILKGRGFSLDDVAPAIKLTEQLR